MAKPLPRGARREDSLTRELIVEAAIGLLDGGGEAGLTFRTLSERLVTGPGAIYHHVASKAELLGGACDAIVKSTLAAVPAAGTPEATIRALALAVFDAIDAHPWVGAALAPTTGLLPLVRLLERLGQQICALGVPDAQHFVVASALLNYILGVGGQNAANGAYARNHGLDRTDFLGTLAATLSDLNRDDFPFTRSIAGSLRMHNDRADFIVGVDLILCGIAASLASPPSPLSNS